MKLKLFGRKKELKHSEAREQLSPYIDGHLGADDRARLELHLQGCRGCAAELEAMRATSALLHALPPARPPRDFTLQAAPRPVVATPRSFFALRLASGVAAAAFVAIFAASALLPAVSAPEIATTASYQGRQQSPEILDTPSAASSKADAATAKRAAPAAAPAAPLAAPAAAPLAAQSAANTPDSGVAAGAAPAAAPAPPAAQNSAAVAAAPQEPSGAGAAAPAATSVPAAPQVMAAPKVQDQAPTAAAGAARTASSAEPSQPGAEAPAAAAAVPAATPAPGQPDRGQAAPPVAPAPRDAASTSPASAAGSPAQPTGVGALSAESAGEQARVAQPVTYPPARENPLQSLLTTLQVVVGGLAVLFGLAAAAVWWTHKSQH